MKATGIVRRIDELGRVVIPKEIRRTQRIRRGDPLEIFTTGDGEVIFKKYSPRGELSGVTAQYVDVLSKCFALTAFVSDRDRILAASGAVRRDMADRSVSQPLEKLMDSRKPYQSDGSPEKALLPCEGSPRALLCAVPIIAAGDVTGSVGLLTEDRTAQPDAAQLKAVNVAAAFLAKQMEEYYRIIEKLLHRAMCGGFFRLRTLSVIAYAMPPLPKGEARHHRGQILLNLG